MIVQPDFLDHWKTQMLVASLNDPLAPLYLIRLWAHCQQRKCARFPNLTPMALKGICRAHNHSSDAFAVALLEAGFIEEEENTIIIHDWEETNASLIANWENGKKGGRPPKPKPIENPSETRGLSMAIPRATHGEPRREEKMREDQNVSEDKSSSPPAGETPVKKKESKPRPTDAEWMDSLKANPIFARLNIDEQVAKARLWCETNHRECTRKFFVNWLNRALDSTPMVAPHRNGHEATKPQPPIPVTLDELRAFIASDPDHVRYTPLLTDPPATVKQMPVTVRELFISWKAKQK